MTTDSERSEQAELARSMVSLVTSIASALVDFPDEVSVHVVTTHDSTTLLLRVAQADLGKVIGKQGRTARSMRTILGAASMKAQHRFALDIQQFDGAKSEPPEPNRPAPGAAIRVLAPLSLLAQACP